MNLNTYGKYLQERDKLWRKKLDRDWKIFNKYKRDMEESLQLFEYDSRKTQKHLVEKENVG